MNYQSLGEFFTRPPRILNSPVKGEISVPQSPGEQDETIHNILLSLLPMSGILTMAIFLLLIASSTGRSALFALPMMTRGYSIIPESLLMFLCY